MKNGKFLAGLIFIIGVGSLCASHNIEKTKYLENQNQESIVDESYGEFSTSPVYVYQKYDFIEDGSYVPTDEFVASDDIVSNSKESIYRFIGSSYNNEIVIYEKERKDSSGNWIKTNEYALSLKEDNEKERYVIHDILTRNTDTNSKQKTK
ncbi:MAG: hypothetical protein IJ193_03025 [Bacilli bacterium]|nr:hypothetical protein [Bacilli bacterium]